MKKKILHISHTDIRFDSRILKEIDSLTQVPHYDVIAYGIEDEFSIDYKPDKHDKIFTFNLKTKKIKYLPKVISYALIYFEAMFVMALPAIRLKPKIIHCHDTLVLPIAVFIKIFTRSKLIYDAHELESQKNGQSFILSKVTFFIELIFWRFINLLITVSPSIDDWYQKKLGSKKSILILNSPNFSQSIFDEISNNYLRIKFNIPSNKKIFIYIGIIGKGRGIDIYLDIFNSPDINSHIVFMGYGELVPTIIQFQKQSSNIHYHTAVPHQDIVKVSKSADVGLAMIENVSLSDYYCLPNKLFEYAFSGLFVIGTDFPDMKKIFYDFDLGINCSFNIEALKKTIKSIEQVQLSKTKKDLYPLSWQCQEVKLINSYSELLNLHQEKPYIVKQ